MIEIGVLFRKEDDQIYFEKEIQKIFDYNVGRSKVNPKITGYTLEKSKRFGRPPLFTKKEVQLIAADHAAGISLNQLAKKYNCSKSSIKKYLRDFKKSLPDV